jgi:hypothetical protein
MWIEHKWGETQRENGDPKVDEERCPQRTCYVKEHDQSPHTNVDAGPGEPRQESAEADTSSREATAGRDVSSTSKGQVAQDGVSVNLGGENFKDQRQ